MVEGRRVAVEAAAVVAAAHEVGRCAVAGRVRRPPVGFGRVGRMVQAREPQRAIVGGVGAGGEQAVAPEPVGGDAQRVVGAERQVLRQGGMPQRLAAGLQHAARLAHPAGAVEAHVHGAAEGAAAVEGALRAGQQLDLRHVEQRRAAALARDVDAVEMQRGRRVDVGQVERRADAAHVDLGGGVLRLEAHRRNQVLRAAQVEHAARDQLLAGDRGHRGGGGLQRLGMLLRGDGHFLERDLAVHGARHRRRRVRAQRLREGRGRRRGEGEREQPGEWMRWRVRGPPAAARGAVRAPRAARDEAVLAMEVRGIRRGHVVLLPVACARSPGVRERDGTAKHRKASGARGAAYSRKVRWPLRRSAGPRRWRAGVMRGRAGARRAQPSVAAT